MSAPRGYRLNPRARAGACARLDRPVAIRARRGGHLLNLDRTLLQSAPFAKAWNDFLGVIATYNMVSRFLVACDIEPEAP